MMRQPRSMRGLEELGRVRLSANFFMRDFLFSEIAGFYGVPNIPEHPDLAVAAGRRLCEELLEPLQNTFGRIGVRSGYRSAKVTAFGNARRHGARIELNAAYHIWTGATGRDIWARPPASSFPGSRTAMPQARTGGSPPGGFTTTLAIRLS